MSPAILNSYLLPFIGFGALLLFVLNRFNIFKRRTLEDPSLAWHHALDVLDAPILLTDNDDNLVHANKAFYRYLKQSKEKVIGKKVYQLLHKHNFHENCDACRNRIAKIDATITREADDESNPLPFPVDIVIRSIKNKEGDVIGALQSFHDISHIRKAEDALRKSEHKLSEAQRIGRMGNWEWNISEDTFDWSTEMWRLFGSPEIGGSQTGYQNFMMHIHHEDRSQVRDSIQQAIENREQGFVVDHRISLPDGDLRHIRHQGKLIYSTSEDCIRLAGVTQDITNQKEIERALHEEKEKAQVTLQSIGDAVLTLDVNGVIDYVNPVAESLLMLTAAEMIGRHHNDVLLLIDEKTHEPIEDPVKKSLVGKIESFYEQIILVRPDGSQFCIAITSAPIIIKNKLVTGATLVIHDVTEMRSLAKQLSHQASHDELTGLVNRREFESRLNFAIESARSTGKHHSLIYMDLDQFKIVNDTCGHIAGDELLKQVSDLLLSKIRDIDTLARLGGDEFAVLIKACPTSVAEKIAEDMRKSIEKFRFAWEDKVFKVGVSIGLVPVTMESGNYTDIMRRADTACYVAKDEGRNRVYTYNSDSRSLDMHHGEMQWAQKISQALENNEFELFSQCIKPVINKDCAHFEILLRLSDGTGNYIQPDAFIPSAERYQLMPSIDRWVIDNTMRHLENMPKHMQWQNYICSINLSGQSLTDQSLLDYITEKMDQYSIDPANICFEITETTAIANLTCAGRFINILRDMGVKFSLDDFGSGLSSFDYLKRLNVDYLKIDGSFVKDIAQDRVDFAMVKSINQIGHLMGVETIAEFVETQDVMQILKVLKVDYVQGFHISSPIPLEQYLYINKQRKRTG